MTSVKWKSAEILKVFGTTIREGCYTGGTSTSEGVIIRDSPTNFTPSKIAKIYENISTHVPIFLGHSTDLTRTPIGYAYKFGVTNTLDDIKYNGFIFNSEAARKISVEGWDKVSPEISPDDEHLLAIAFVPNPAISGTGADIDTVVFSKPTTPGDGTMTEVTEGVIGGEATEVTQTPPAAPQPVAPREVKQATPAVSSNNDLATISAQLEEYKSKFEQQAAKTDQLLTAQYDVVVQDMKGLGVDDPGSIVRGLPVEQKIAVLSKVRESIAKTKPLAQPTTSTTQVEQKNTVETALNEVLKELGVEPEEYAKISGK